MGAEPIPYRSYGLGTVGSIFGAVVLIRYASQLYVQMMARRISRARMITVAASESSLTCHSRPLGKL